MKKFIQLLFFGVAIFNCSIVNAQDKLFSVDQNKEIKGWVNTGLPTAKTTIDAERVKSTARYIYDTAINSFIRFDSVDYSWSFDRSSRQFFRDIYSGTTVEMKDYDVREFKYFFFGFLPSNKWIQSFDTDGNIIQNTQKRWNDASSTWEDLFQIKYSYSGKLKTEEIEQEMDTKTLKWLNNTRRLYSYSGTNLIENKLQYWNPILNIWENIDRLTYTYNTGHVETEKSEFWDFTLSIWVFRVLNKTEYIFSGSNILESTTRTWDPTSSSWKKIAKDSNIYFGGLLAEKWNMSWNTLNDSLKFKSGMKYYYSAGMLSEIDFVPADGKIRGRTLYLYDGKNNTEIINQLFNDTTSIWENRRRRYFTFNKNSSLIIIDQQEWKDGAWKPIETNDLFDTRLVFHYESYTSRIKNESIDFSKTSIYPNPAIAANVYVDYFTNDAEPTEIVLQDVLGRELTRIEEKASIGDHSVMLPVGHLSNGIYMVGIYSNGKLHQTLKLVK